MITGNNKQLLQELVALSQKQLKEYLLKELIRYYEKTDIFNVDGGILVKGFDHVTLVAHMDRIYDDNPSEKILKGDRVVSCDTGIGGDDRCGILMILKMLKKGYRPSIIFTEDEEQGLVGSNKLIKNNLALLKEVNISSAYLLQLDRKGVNEAVFYDCENYEFIDYITYTFDLDEEQGSSTDVKALGPALDLAYCNISTGYYGQHHIDEIVDLDDLDYMINILEKMIIDSNRLLGKYNFEY